MIGEVIPVPDTSSSGKKAKVKGGCTSEGCLKFHRVFVSAMPIIWYKLYVRILTLPFRRL